MPCGSSGVAFWYVVDLSTVTPPLCSVPDGTLPAPLACEPSTGDIPRGFAGVALAYVVDESTVAPDDPVGVAPLTATAKPLTTDQ
jgi:hypothetical protein